MSGLIALAVIALAVCCILTTLTLIGFVLKLLFWVVLFPIRLALKLVFGILGVGLAVIAAPIVLLIAGIAIFGALVAAVIAIVTPLLPVILLLLLGWAIYRISSRPSVSGFAR